MQFIENAGTSYPLVQVLVLISLVQPQKCCSLQHKKNCNTMLRAEFVKFNMGINFVEAGRSTAGDSKGGRDVKCLGLQGLN